jgi:hypothetical protein
MNTAQRIAEAMDRHLAEKTEIIVFGSAALLLDPHCAQHLTVRVTNDVDIIIPAEREVKVDADRGFWKAIESANKELEPEGLYITHIFPEREVTLTPEWKQHTVRLETPDLEKLRVSRPRVLDLVISKMGRGDAQDLEDVHGLLRLEHKMTGKTITAAEVQAAAGRARVPPVYREIFPEARRRIVAVAQEVERALTIRAALVIPPPEEKHKQSRGIRP